MSRSKMINRLKKLKGLDSAIENAKLLGDLPEGKYQGRIVSAELKDSKSKEAMIELKIEVVNDEEYNGKEVRSYIMLEGSSSHFGIKTLERMDLEVTDDPEELATAIEELGSGSVEIMFTVKEEGKLPSIDGLAEPSEDEEDEEEEDEDETVEGDEEEEDEEGEESEEDDDEEEDEESEEEEEDESDEESEDDDSEEDSEVDSEIEEGSLVSFVYKKKELEGEVIEIDEEEDEARVETEDGKIVTVPMNTLTLISEEPEETEEEEEDEEEEEEEQPKKKAKKEKKAEPKAKAKTKAKPKAEAKKKGKAKKEAPKAKGKAKAKAKPKAAAKKKGKTAKKRK